MDHNKASSAEHSREWASTVATLMFDMIVQTRPEQRERRDENK
jgi:hypothetical protein